MSRDLIRLMHSLFLPAATTFQEVSWRPAADVYRTRYGWLVKFDLAGVRPEDIRVVLHGRRLTVQGLRRDCTEEEGCHYYSMEIAYSYFERRLELPANLEPADVATEYRDGMLLVRIRTEAPREAGR
jgi:HSP20 family protein